MERMVMTETEKRDWEQICDLILPQKDGETREEKTERFDQQVEWLGNRVYELRKESRALSDLRDGRPYRDIVGDFAECAKHLTAQLNKAVQHLGDEAAIYAFRFGLQQAKNREDFEAENEGK